MRYECVLIDVKNSEETYKNRILALINGNFYILGIVVCL